ncbi:MAG: hypothetical protein OER87_12265 [Gammaproteobacteria bacterium]|nr:hypothetical protein [Gammaproteobacteria bacterium]
MNTRTWRKLGRIFDAEFASCHPKMLSHAANPLPVLIENDIYRVYFGCRDEHNRSSVGIVDIDIVRRDIVQRYDRPVFEYGPAGSFYADGVSVGNTYTAGDVTYMLFMGWQNSPLTHWRGDIGRLIVHDDLSLGLDSETPLLGSDQTDPVSLSYPWVMRLSEGDFRMWYGSTVTWDAGNGEMLHVINQAVSADGSNWRRQGIAVPYDLGIAQAFSRPTVIGDYGSGYHMWFSYRSGSGQKYRIGYAYSEDGASWDLALEHSGVDVSPAGWDSDMIEYPYVLVHKDQEYMLYNGNGYGKSGFGIAVLE